MFLDSFFRSPDSHGPRTRARCRAGHAVLHLERLEDRAVPSFLAPRAFDTGDGPIYLVVRDINGDGLADLAVYNQGSFPDYIASVSVHLGNGDGTFQATRYVAGINPRSLALEDFNGDGRLDLAVVIDGLYMLLGNGDGTFQTAQRVGDLGFSTVGECNGEGRLDLAGRVAAGGYVLLGNGDGTFQLPRYFPLPVEAYIRGGAGDFNGDGRLDLTVVEGSLPYFVRVLLGNGDGTFRLMPSRQVSSRPDWLVAGDYNADGRLDLAVIGDGGNGRLNVLLGN